MTARDPNPSYWLEYSIVYVNGHIRGWNSRTKFARNYGFRPICERSSDCITKSRTVPGRFRCHAVGGCLSGDRGDVTRRGEGVPERALLSAFGPAVRTAMAAGTRRPFLRPLEGRAAHPNFHQCCL